MRCAITSSACAPKQKAHALIDQLPDTATWDDVIEEMRFRKAVEEGIAQACRSDFAKPEDVRAAFAKWGAKTIEWTRLALQDFNEAQNYIAQDNPLAAQAVAQRIADAAKDWQNKSIT